MGELSSETDFFFLLDAGDFGMMRSSSPAAFFGGAGMSWLQHADIPRSPVSRPTSAGSTVEVKHAQPMRLQQNDELEVLWERILRHRIGSSGSVGFLAFLFHLHTIVSV